MPDPSGLKLLVITELLLPTKGGTAVWFDEVYRRLGGKHIHIVTADVPGAVTHDALHQNTVHRVPLERHAWLRPESLAMYLRLLWTCVRLAFTQRLDAVHAGRVLPEGLVGWVVAKLRGLPLVIYAHGEEITTWRQPGKFKAMVFTYRRADCVIANSDFTRDELLKLGVDPARIVLISPGVDVTCFKPGLATADLRASLGIGDATPLIVSVGRLQRRKGFDQIIRALQAVIAQGIDAHYAMIGIGEDRDYLMALARECGVAERVHLLGHVAVDDLPRWYNAATVVVMPNREINGDTEGFGMVFLEAAACGKPTIAGRAGGTGAAVVEGVTGLRVDGTDTAAVAAAVMQLLTDTDFAQRLGAAGYARAVREFSWEAVADKTRRLVMERGDR